MTEPFGVCLFCDDIRFEIFNKASLIGIYGYELISWQKFPQIIPRLGLYVCARFHRSEKVNGGKLLIYLPGDEMEKPSMSQDLDMHLSAEDFHWPDKSEYPDPGEYLGFNHPVVLNSVAIKQAGYIRVRVVAAGHTVKVGVLRIREATDEERTAFGVPHSA